MFPIQNRSANDRPFDARLQTRRAVSSFAPDSTGLPAAGSAQEYRTRSAGSRCVERHDAIAATVRTRDGIDQRRTLNGRLNPRLAATACDIMSSASSSDRSDATRPIVTVRVLPSHPRSVMRSAFTAVRSRADVTLMATSPVARTSATCEPIVAPASRGSTASASSGNAIPDEARCTTIDPRVTRTRSTVPRSNTVTRAPSRRDIRRSEPTVDLVRVTRG